MLPSLDSYSPYYLSEENIIALVSVTLNFAIATIRAHLGSTCHIVVFADVEVADGAG